jgi:hypothetical protein
VIAMLGPQHTRTGAPSAGRAILAALQELPADAPTACVGWDAHDIAAHLAAGAKEVADLIEEQLASRPERATRGFEERERPFRALAHEELLERLVAENVRKVRAYEALAELEGRTVPFTGTRMTLDELTTHSRSEAALHRWDLVGDDDVSDELLADPLLTAHAVKILDRMHLLDESANAMGERAALVSEHTMRVVLRAPQQPDVVFDDSRACGRFELEEHAPADADVVVTMDPAQRLLALWGRRSVDRPIATNGEETAANVLGPVFWPRSQPWPRRPSAES